MIAGVNIEPEKYYKEKVDNERVLILAYEDDFRDYRIYFDKVMKTYECTFSQWLDLSNCDYVPAGIIEGKDDIPLGTKRTSYYGVWQRAHYDINMELHEFIDRKITELGWKEKEKPKSPLRTNVDEEGNEYTIIPYDAVKDLTFVDAAGRKKPFPWPKKEKGK